MASIPTLVQNTDRLVQIPGTMPRLNAIPAGCAFNPRCEHSFDRCLTERPPLIGVAPQHAAACWLADKEIRNDG